jgi:hypothetical protein
MSEQTDNQDERDANLLVVWAVESYARNHGITGAETMRLFQKADLLDKIRSSYPALHTQDLDYTAEFAEAVLARMG